MYEFQTTNEFRKELEQLINKHGIDAELNTADFILANYLNSCLYVFETATIARDKLKQTMEKFID